MEPSMKHPAWSAVAVALLVTACSTLPERDASVEQARSSLGAAEADPHVAALAPKELNEAQQAFDRADAAWRNRDGEEKVDHLAYLASRRSAIAVETARQRAAETAVANATAERERVRLAARTHEADVARHAADEARARADAARVAADQARQRAATASANAETLAQQAQQDRTATERALAQSRAQAEQSSRAIALSQQQADQAQLQADQARQHVAQLQQELNQLEAQPSDRGMVITLNDVLFDTGSDQLKPGGVRALRKLAGFLRAHPERRVEVEGFTDSVGDARYNQQLSERRAQSVARTLGDMNVDRSRIVAEGFGESYPVASNTAAGRQLNRRVEIVISDASGKVASR
jgi:outer membrane protein OmpA-like peptidoglycan-associated protein